MNLSGQAATVGHFAAAAGAGLAFLSPALGWFGVAVSGSDTSAVGLAGREGDLLRKVLPWSGTLPVMRLVVVGRSAGAGLDAAVATAAGHCGDGLRLRPEMPGA